MPLILCLRLGGLRDGNHLGVGQQTIDFVHQSRGNLVAASDDFDDVDDVPFFGQVLNGVQVGENAGIIHRAGLRQHGRHGELLAEHVERIGILQPERGGHVGPHEDFVVLKRLDDFLAGKRFLVVRSHHADRLAAADGTRERPRSGPGRFRLELLFRQDAREVKVLALELNGHRQLGRNVVESRDVGHRQLRDVFLGNRVALQVGIVVVLQGGRLGKHQDVGPQGVQLLRHGSFGVVGDVLDRHDHRDSQQDGQEAGEQLALALEDSRKTRVRNRMVPAS